MEKPRHHEEPPRRDGNAYDELWTTPSPRRLPRRVPRVRPACAECLTIEPYGRHYFIALGEIHRVAQILSLSLQCFKPWVLAEPDMLSKLLACLDICINAWISGLEIACKRVVDNNLLGASVAKALMESINNINETEVTKLQNFLPTNI